MRFELFGLAGLFMTLLTAVAMAAEDRYGDPLPEGATQRLGSLRMRYASGIGDLCYLPDGRAAFAIGSRVELCDMAKGALLATHEIGKSSSLTSIVPRRDGKALLAADYAGTVYEWDLEAKRALRNWPTGQVAVRRACYSPDETRVLTTGGSPPTLKEWDLATGKELVSITGRMHFFHEGIYGPDGKTAWVDGGASSGPVLAHYDLVAAKLLKELLPDHYTHGRSIALSADGQRVLVGSRHKATEWQPEGYKLLKTFTGHHGHAVTSVAHCRETDQLLTGSRDGSIRVWAEAAEPVAKLEGHRGGVLSVALSPDGQRIKELKGHEQAVHSLALSPDGQRLVSASADTTLLVRAAP